MSVCVHGYERGQCLICQTLGTVATDPAPRRRSWFGGRDAPAPAPFVSGPPAGGRRHHPAATAALVVVVLIAAGLAAWVAIGAIYAIFRIIEVLAVAVAAGWLGYRVGHWRGRHER